ncbi:MAG: hypothetical protein SGPRY_013810, partial [Prymnesium sp.]
MEDCNRTLHHFCYNEFVDRHSLPTGDGLNAYCWECISDVDVEVLQEAVAADRATAAELARTTEIDEEPLKEMGELEQVGDLGQVGDLEQVMDDHEQVGDRAQRSRDPLQSVTSVTREHALAALHSEAARVLCRARELAAERHGPRPSSQSILAIASSLCDRRGREGESDGASEGRGASGGGKEAGLECTSCGETDPAMFSSRMINKRGRHGDRVRRCRACVETSQSLERSGRSETNPTSDETTRAADACAPSPALAE